MSSFGLSLVYYVSILFLIGIATGCVRESVVVSRLHAQRLAATIAHKKEGRNEG